MASDTKNVQVGVCKVFLGGEDLGYTIGGVSVEVTSETFKVEVDQFGKSPISESIMGRTVTAKVPMAETTIEQMVRIMPGAVLSQVGGTKASGSITLGVQPTNGQTLVVNGQTVTFKTTVVTAATEVAIGANAAATAANLAAFLEASTIGAIASANYTASGAVVAVQYSEYSTAGNLFTLGAGTSGLTVSGATLLGGVASTQKRVTVSDAVGTNLLTIAKELRLHPQGKPDSDTSDDFVIPLAATAGALSFAYQLEEVRVFNCEFSGYPDPTTRTLYYVGN